MGLRCHQVAGEAESGSRPIFIARHLHIKMGIISRHCYSSNQEQQERKEELLLKRLRFGKREGFELDSKGYKFPISYIDLFYLEDNNFEEFLQEFIINKDNRK